MPSPNEILFGADPTTGIVAVEPGFNRVVVFRREGAAVVREERSFSPWLLTCGREDIPASEWRELEGDGYNRLAVFDSWADFQEARKVLRHDHISHTAFPSADKQYLALSGRTLFKGMSLDDVHRMQLDIETLGFSPEPEEAAVFMVALSDNRGFETVISGSEEEILRETVRVVREIDPDVIEGHNILGFDFPYLAKRSEMRGIPLALGRDNSPLRLGAERSFPVGGTSRPFRPAYVYGRQVVDTLPGVQRYDVPRGMLASHGLKEVAQAFGVAEQDRVLIPHKEIARAWRTDPERVRKYAMQDALETRAVAEIVFPAEFYTAQMVPESYQNSAISGTGEKINSILIREYLRQGKAIPRPQEPHEVPGGYTDVRKTGMIHRVVKCDVESLYPSIMLTRRVKPASDTLDVFLPALAELTARRVDAKARARAAQGNERAYWDGLQSSFKILINSFYGYLGAAFHFNDFAAAEQVTLTGQKLIKQIVGELERTGSEIIEIDTDGIYFQAPPGVDTEEDEVAYVDRIAECLPEGIRLAHDGRYRLMISLKVKNYALVGYDGSRVFRGASLRSRADERFGREFIAAAIDLLVQDRPEAVTELYEDFANRIREQRLPLDKFSRRERVTEKTFTSSAKRRSAEVAKAARVGEYINVYQRRDGSLALVADYAGDEDQDYLLDKLYKFACRLREAFGDDFDRLFPRPSVRSRSEAAGQQRLGLFD